MRKFRLAAIAASSSLILTLHTNAAPALLLSNQQISKVLATGAWGTQLATSNGNGTTAPFQITWTGGSNKQYELMAIINSGNFDLIAQHLTFSSAKGNGDTTAAPALTFESCSGIWDVVTFACSGTISLIGNAISGSININRYLITGNRIVLRITHNRNGSGNYLTTFNTQSFRSDLRYGITINS